MGQIAPADSDRLAKRIVSHHSFPGASHAAIERVLAQGDCTQLPHGAAICREGEPGDEVFFLVRGNITVLRRDNNGEDRILSDMTCPCVFGHMSVIDGSKRSATCLANGPVEVVKLKRVQVDNLIAEGSVAGTALRRLLIDCGELLPGIKLPLKASVFSIECPKITVYRSHQHQIISRDWRR